MLEKFYCNFHFSNIILIFTWSLRFLNAKRLCSLHSAPCEKTIPPEPSLSPSSSEELEEKNALMIVRKFFGLPVTLSSLNALDQYE